MCFKKGKTLKNVVKFLCHTGILVLILIPALMILIPGCNPTEEEKKGTCGAPGYTWNSVGCTIYLTWLCADPCKPTVAYQVLTGTATDQYTQTVYCEHSDYNTSSGVSFRYWCR